MFGKKSLKCPTCKSTDIIVQMVSYGSKTKRSGVGLLGRTHNAVRGVASVATLGLAGLVIPKAQGKNKTKEDVRKMAICQRCGSSWEVE